MAYTREELDWVEAEWAFHLHGRSAFLSREDFAQLQVWDREGIPAERVVKAMEAFFQRRALRPTARGFVALKHLDKDLEKLAKLEASLARAGAEPSVAVGGWEKVQAPLASDPKARSAWEAWKRLAGQAPSPDSPGYLEHHDEVRKAFRAFLALAVEALGPRRESLAAELRARLLEARLQEGTLVWDRAWDHHWSRTVCETWGVEP